MDYTVAFYVVLALLLLALLVAVILSIVQSYKVPEVYDALFRFKDMAITHGGHTKMSVVIHQVYSAKTKYAKMPTDADVQQTVRTVMSSPTFTAKSPWEQVARDIAHQLWANHSPLGVSVEILLPNETGNGDVQCATFTQGWGVDRILKLDAQP